MKTLYLFAALCLSICVLPAQAGDAPDVKLKATITKALDVFYGGDAEASSPEEKREQIRSILSESYDLSVIVRRAMGRNWNQLSESQQQEVLDLFEQLVVKVTYEGLTGTAEPQVSYGALVTVTDKRVEVPSSVTADGKTYNLVYRLGLLQSGWQIYDIVAEDISLVSNYRQQFDDHFRRSDGAALVAKLKELLNKETLDLDANELSL